MESMLFTSSQSPSSSAVLSFQNPNLSSTNFHRNQLFSLYFRNRTAQSKRHPATAAVSCSASQQTNMAAAPAKEAKLWGGRFEEGVTDAVERFTESISFDKALYKQDIMGSRAHASMLAKQGLISFSDRDSIIEGLNQIEKQIEKGEFVWRTDREDVHMNIEAHLTDIIGEPAKKLHTARSRNDQVSTDFRLWCREAIDTIISDIKNLQLVLVNLAKKNIGVIVPGNTSLQSSQPVLLHNRLLAYIEQLECDAKRLADCRVRLNFCPLGACALAGTGLPIDRFMTSDALGFTAPMRNSMDAVSDRDFVLELLSGNATLGMHLSLLAEEWAIWASVGPNNSGPNDSGSAGPMEVVRGKSARVSGDLVTLLVLCKGLPLAYNRDLQEDKEPVFDSVKTVTEMLTVLTEFAHDKIKYASPAGSLENSDDIIQSLSQIEKQIEKGEFEHMNDDQFVTDFHTWCHDAIDETVSHIKHLQVCLVNLAKKNSGVIVPGYTHLQRAQPVLLQHHLLAYVEQLERDAGRLLDCIVRMNSSSLDSKDLVLEILCANAITAMHLSRLGEEWVLWASEEFGFITPSDSVSTGSSIMPQKKNPDPMELVRGKSARVFGDLVTLLVFCKGLPLAYNPDLQEVKEGVSDSVKTILGMLEVSAEFAQNITYNQDRIQKALPAGHLDATTLADYLVHKDIPFRTSHDIVGRAVALCVYKKCELRELSIDELRGINTVFDEGVYDYLGVENSIKKFSSYGSTGSKCVADQLDFWISSLNLNQ